MKLLLASGSETRRRMLADAGVPFSWSASHADEEEAKQRLLASARRRRASPSIWPS
jgi:predicted house-cleaning NTP pyrophosphatase (Maf/HAM1 superfamily)